MAKKFDGDRELAVVMLNKRSLSPSLDYLKQSDKLYLRRIFYGLVLRAQGVCKSWKQPFDFYNILQRHLASNSNSGSAIIFDLRLTENQS